MSNFKGKKVLITGGASGIGLLMGRMALEKGAEVLRIWDINCLAMREVAEKFDREGYQVDYQFVDVSDKESVAEAVALCRANGFVPDILILNAGVVFGGLFIENSFCEIEKTMGVNVLGALLTAHGFLPQLIGRGSGHLVTIASAASMLANPGMAVYAASKWAVYGWSESLRLEMERMKTGVKVTTVTPSFISTGMFEGAKTGPLIPLLTPEKAVKKIIRGIENDRHFVRMPALVYALPFVKGVLPARWFDVFAGKWMGVYQSMDHFTGRKND